MPFSQPESIQIVPARFLPWITGRQAGTPLFFNRRNQDGAGHEQVYQEFLLGSDVPLAGMALFSGDTGELYLDGCEIEYFLAWFNAHRGKLRPFQFRYWGDYKCSSNPDINCLDDSMGTQGVTWPFKGDGTTTKFRLLKSYFNGNEISYRRIRVPIISTLNTYVDGVLTSSALDADGIINFAIAPSVDAVITHDCEFDLVVRFDTDQFAIEVIASEGDAELYKLAPLPIVELAPLPIVEPVEEPPPN